MRKRYWIFTLLSLLLLVACDDTKKNEIAERERILLEKEKSFALKELDYKKLQKMRDSLFAANTNKPIVVSLPDSIKGQWNGKLICTESNCADHVIGDQRIDLWEISEDSSKVIAKIINKNNLVRIYSGTYDGTKLDLTFKTDSTSDKQIEMQVLLNDVRTNKIKGSRDISINNSCKAKFSIELDRINK